VREGIVLRVGAATLLSTLCTLGCAARAPEFTGPPPVPARAGPLTLDVVYPPAGSQITARDSNFIFGSVGNGAARLTINGRPVRVEANGAYLAWLPVPARALDTLARYELVASHAGTEKRLVHSVRLPNPPIRLPADSAAIDKASLTPRGRWWVRPGEAVPLRVRASPGASVRLLLPDGTAKQLDEIASPDGASAGNWNFGQLTALSGETEESGGVFVGRMPALVPLGRARREPDLNPLVVDSVEAQPFCGAEGAASDPLPLWGGGEADVSAAGALEAVQDIPAVWHGVPSDCAMIEVAVDGDTVWAPLELDLWILNGSYPVVELRDQPSPVGRDGFITGRTAPGATTYWQWTDGVRAGMSGRRNGSLRLQLDGQTAAWVAEEEVVGLVGVELSERARVGTVRFRGQADRLQVRVSVSQPVPFHVLVDGRRLTLVLHGVYADTDWMQYGSDNPFLESARWEQASEDRYLLHIDLAQPPWGYRVRHGPGLLALDIRRPPVIDVKHPLEGRTIVIDPGHPPAGATGPTRLYEGDANLGIAFRLKRLLENEGAQVTLTRADRSPVRLYDRTFLAELLDAELLISIHNNALPDGVNPFENHGTSVYYFHPHSLDLARALQGGLLGRLGLRDLGFGRSSLALVRPTWPLAVLTEGAFMMIPAQEAGLRQPDYLEAYARGVVDGIRDFLTAGAE